MASQPISRKRRKPLQLSLTESGEDFIELSSRGCFSQRVSSATDVPYTECDSSIITSQHLDTCDMTNELMMCDRFAPRNPADLAVHTNKIKELKKWIEHAKMERDCLLLTGPPGSGKSTAVRVLCSNSKVILQEWDFDEIFDENTMGNAAFIENEAEQFYGFIRSRGNIVNDGPVIKFTEYLPTAAYSDTANFRDKLRTAIQRSPHSVIFCLSDVSSCFEVSPQRVFPQHFIREEHYTSISFNQVAKSILCKALKRVRDLLCNRKKKISDEKLNTIAELAEGDLRLCFNTLHFCLNVDGMFVDVDSGLRSVQCDEKFHMIGRILHAHREPTFTESQPFWLSEHLRRPLPKNDINDILAMSALDQTELALYLHEYAPKFSPSLNSTAKILEAISFTDAMTDRWDVRLKIKENYKDKTMSKMGEYQAQIAARAVYFNNHNASNSNFSGFRRPKSKELDREIWNLSQELRHNMYNCRVGFNIIIEQIAMFSQMRISVLRNEYEIVKYISRPFTWLWDFGRLHYNSKLRQTQAKNAWTAGADVIISETSSVFSVLNACELEMEANGDEDNVIIDDSEQENLDDSFDEDPFD